MVMLGVATRMCGFCYRSQPSLSSAKSSQHSTIYITTAEQRIRIRRQLQQQGDLSPEQQPRRPTQRPLASSVSSQLLDVSVDVSRQGELAAWVWERSGASASTLQQQQRRQQQEWRGGGGISSGGHANVGSTPTREMQAPLLPVVEWSNSSGKDAAGDTRLASDLDGDTRWTLKLDGYFLAGA